MTHREIIDTPGKDTQEPPISVSKDRIFYEQGLLLFRAAPMSVAGTFLGMLFVVLILWYSVDHTKLWIWTGLYILLTCLRAVHTYWFLSHHESLNINLWTWQFATGSLSSAAFWGSTAIFLFPVHSPLYQAMLEIVLLIACTVAITNIAMVRSIVFSFILLTLLPLIVRYFSLETEQSALMGMLSSVALILYLLGANRYYQTTTDNIRHRLEATESERQLRQSQQRLSLHIKNTPLAVIEWDPEFNVTQWNRAAERIFGYQGEEVIGHNGLELIVPAQHRARIEQTLCNLKKRHDGDYSLNENITKDGDIILCEWFNTTLIDDLGNVIGLASLVNDVTERVRGERLKNEFVSTVSHELRTPLTSMRGSLGLVLGGISGKLQPKTRDLLQMADNNAARLHNLINDLLDIQKIESGLAIYQMQETSIMPLIEQALQENLGFAQQGNIDLCICTRADDAVILADTQRILQVLANLISNAIKFSPPHAQVDIDVETMDGYVMVSVSDHGPGISDDFLPKLFDKFSQADASSSRSFAGTGLGLSIAKGIIEAHNGELKYRRSDLGGSCFYFQLPLVVSKPI